MRRSEIGIILALITGLAVPISSPQRKPTPPPAVEEHIHEIIQELPADSSLRRALAKGARGKGVHYPWMDKMRKLGIRRVVVWIDIRFSWRGHPKKMNFNRAEYFTQYEGGIQNSDSAQLGIIRTTGLEKQLSALALERAKHGFWCDVPRPRPHPFVGRTQIEFLDDEWLPAMGAPLYQAIANRK